LRCLNPELDQRPSRWNASHWSFWINGREALGNPSDSTRAEFALQTGARYGELVRLTVADFNPDVGTVAIRRSKSGRSRHIVLTEEGRLFFRQITTGRAGDELILRNMTRIERAVEAEYERCKSAMEKIDKKAIRDRIVDDGAWRPSHQLRPMAEAVRHAKIRPAISFHGLRHTWASLSVMTGVPCLSWRAT
jgi:integrase